MPSNESPEKSTKDFVECIAQYCFENELTSIIYEKNGHCVSLHTKMKFSVKDIFFKSEQLCTKLRICLHFLCKSLTKNNFLFRGNMNGSFITRLSQVFSNWFSFTATIDYWAINVCSNRLNLLPVLIDIPWQ